MQRLAALYESRPRAGIEARARVARQIISARVSCEWMEARTAGSWGGRGWSKALKARNHESDVPQENHSLAERKQEVKEDRLRGLWIAHAGVL